MNAMPTKSTCVCCQNLIDSDALTFEQRLIEDRDFCVGCWNEIMNPDLDGFDIELPSL